jgi:hypothetical protein
LLVAVVAGHTTQMTAVEVAVAVAFLRDCFLLLRERLTQLLLAVAALRVMRVLGLVLPEPLGKTLFLVL